jgi:hypothetical protein
MMISAKNNFHLEVGFQFRFFLFWETRNKAKQKICFAKFCLFHETIKTAKFCFVLFCFVSSKVKFRFVLYFFSCFVTWIPFTFVKFHIFSCFAFWGQESYFFLIVRFSAASRAHGLWLIQLRLVGWPLIVYNCFIVLISYAYHIFDVFVVHFRK